MRWFELCSLDSKPDSLGLGYRFSDSYEDLCKVFGDFFLFSTTRVPIV